LQLEIRDILNGARTLIDLGHFGFIVVNPNHGPASICGSHGQWEAYISLPNNGKNFAVLVAHLNNLNEFEREKCAMTD
jgi:predicted NBD/HSP70 family sugar kinase